MAEQIDVPIGVEVSGYVEYRASRRKPYRARVRWTDPMTHERMRASESFYEEEPANDWIKEIQRKAEGGVSPSTAKTKLADYGRSVWILAMRGLEDKTMDPYSAGWRKLVVPSVGHIELRQLSHGIVDRAVHSWIAEGVGKSSVKNAIAALVRVSEQAVRDGLIDSNPSRVVGWQRQYKEIEAELQNPRSLALPDFATLQRLADGLVAASADDRTKDKRTYPGWGEIVMFAACTATRIGEVSGVRIKDVDTEHWIWKLVRQTTPGPGGLQDKNPKNKRARDIPIMPEIRPMVLRRITEAGPTPDPMTRLFTGPRGGRVSTAVLRDATHWDEVVSALGLQYLRRHDLRHTGLTWMADAGVPVHVLRVIAGHGSLSTTQRYLHPDRKRIQDAGTSLNDFLKTQWPPIGPQEPEEEPGA